MAVSLQKQGLIGLFVAIVILVLIGGLFLNTFSQLYNTTNERQETYNMMAAMNEVVSTLKDAETGQRGYLLTQRKTYLADYLNAKQHLQIDYAKLQPLAHKSMHRKQQIDALWELINAKMSELNETIELNDKTGTKAALALVLTDKGFDTMNHIRQQMKILEDWERERLKAMNDKVQTSYTRTVWISIVAGIAAFGLLITGYGMLSREMSAREVANVQLLQEAAIRKAAEEDVKRLNADLENQVQQLNMLNKELETFSYSVSHDLRAPLRSIDGFSQALLQKYTDVLDEKGKDYLSRVRANSQRMAQLIDDMLQLSRLTRGQLKMETVNLSQIAEEILHDLRESEPDRVVETKVQPNIIVTADKRLLQAVLQNLIGNSWKFTGEHATAHIEFGIATYNGQKAYFVKDDGAGFDMAYADKLFGAFQRLHAMNEFPGTGIGLATVQRIIHRHNGTIWAEGAVEKGATFYFTL